LEKAIHSGGHVGQEKGVREIFEARLEEMRDGLELAEPAIYKALREQRRDVQGVGELSGEERLRRGDCPTKFHFKILTADYADERGLKTKMKRRAWNIISRRGFGWGTGKSPEPQTFLLLCRSHLVVAKRHRKLASHKVAGFD
jgi:hypothetical protein